MGYVWQRWLADEFRAAGLDVVEVEGWKNRGRPASTGSFDPQGQHTVHHTGTFASASNPAPSLSVLIFGRSDLPGPLCQFAVAYDGKVYVIAAGRANHAGRIGKSGVTGMPLGADGNALAIGDEVMTNGTQALSAAQEHAIAVTSAVVIAHSGKDVAWIHRHADISGTGKWDLGSRTTPQLRALAGAVDLTPEADMWNPRELLSLVITSKAKGSRTVADALRLLFNVDDRTKATIARLNQLDDKANANAAALAEIKALLNRQSPLLPTTPTTPPPTGGGEPPAPKA